MLCLGVSIWALVIPTKWVLGLNKYSHDAGACLLSIDGRRSIVVPNERLSRVKHDGGNTAAAVRHALDGVGGSLEDIIAVCSNNHHHRVAPFEERLPWAVPMGLYASSALSEDNLLPGVPRYELSHHLSHVWSSIAQAPFEHGLVVVMDGMGETYAAMQAGLEHGDDAYMHDLRLPEAEGFSTVPAAASLGTPPGFREAESAYQFDGREVSRIFKRWIPQRSPSELYNHGFENLESVGALYSRVSSHIFGDWNACGKVMGLAPWAESWAAGAELEELRTTPLLRGDVDGHGEEALAIEWKWLAGLPHCNGFGSLQKELGEAIMEGSAATQASAGVADGAISEGALLTPAREAERGMYVALANRVQQDLEETTVSWLRRLQAQTGESNLCFVGGVAQNSVLNGRIAREAGFEHVFIPPYPGDEGVAAGCAAYAQQVLLPQLGLEAPPPRLEPWTAYQGREYTADDLCVALAEFEPWVEEVGLEEVGGEEVGGEAAAGEAAAGGGEEAARLEDEALVDGADLEACRTLEAELEAQLETELAAEEARATAREAAAPKDIVDEEAAWDAPSAAVVQYAAEALARGEILGWVGGRAEVGARALGHRSILANPGIAANHRKVNIVKQREQWRPLAPSVLAEEAEEWFDGLPTSASPYMQITAQVREDVCERVPSITHVDGSARLQTVGRDDAPIYHALIAAFFALTGIPMVMNTSFNLARMPIVESPRDALSCFLEADPALSVLVLHGRVLRRKPFPPADALGDAVPTQQKVFVSRCLSDAAGAPLRAEVLVEERWIELTDALELEVLESCAPAESSAVALATALSADSDGAVSEADVVERLQHLYKLCLISMD